MVELSPGSPCRSVVERLPWLLNGSLDEDERRMVEDHLERCGECRSELEATRSGALVFAAHPPVEDVVALASGADPLTVTRETMDVHLAHCEACRGELEDVRSVEGEVSDLHRPAMVPQRSSPARWRNLAVAAGLLAVFAFAGWFRTASRTGDGFAGPSADLRIVELAPDTERTRGGDTGPTVDLHHPAAVLLLTNRAEDFDAWRIRATDTDGEPAWILDGTASGIPGAHPLLLPAGALPAGAWTIVLEGRRGDHWTVVERYSLMVTGD